jgi:hypothetical protein
MIGCGSSEMRAFDGYHFIRMRLYAPHVDPPLKERAEVESPVNGAGTVRFYVVVSLLRWLLSPIHGAFDYSPLL